MLRTTQRRVFTGLRSRCNLSKSCQKRYFTPAPRPGDGPLLSRRADRELPDIREIHFRWSRSLPIFIAIVAVCSVAIFNYQKMSSPIISSTLYALRTSSKARSILGDEIYFKHQIPWIHGQMNQVQGRINVWFTVRGNRSTGVMRFASHRPSSRSLFKTTEWSLTTEDGQHIDLLDGEDPFRGLLGRDEGLLPLSATSPSPSVAPSLADTEDAVTRGFRQAPRSQK